MVAPAGRVQQQQHLRSRQSRWSAGGGGRRARHAPPPRPRRRRPARKCRRPATQPPPAPSRAGTPGCTPPRRAGGNEPRQARRRRRGGGLPLVPLPTSAPWSEPSLPRLRPAAVAAAAGPPPSLRGRGVAGWRGGGWPLLLLLGLRAGSPAERGPRSRCRCEAFVSSQVWFLLGLLARSLRRRCDGGAGCAFRAPRRQIDPVCPLVSTHSTGVKHQPECQSAGYSSYSMVLGAIPRNFAPLVDGGLLICGLRSLPRRRPARSKWVHYPNAGSTTQGQVRNVRRGAGARLHHGLGAGLAGALPPSLGDLGLSLTDLYLNYNAITSLPTEIGALTGLEVLKMVGNAITSTTHRTAPGCTET